MKTLPAPTAAPDSKSPRQVCARARAPRPLQVWLQVGVVLLLLLNGVQTALHFYKGQASRMAQTPPASSTQKLSGFEYYYEPDRLVSAAQTPSGPSCKRGMITILMAASASAETCSPRSSTPVITPMPPAQ